MSLNFNSSKSLLLVSPQLVDFEASSFHDYTYPTTCTYIHEEIHADNRIDKHKQTNIHIHK